MSTYTVIFRNNTDRVWTMVVFQTLPNSTGLDSVSWLQAAAPPGGTARVHFDPTYNVVLADFRREPLRDIYRAAQTLFTNLGTAWQVVLEDGEQQLMPAGQAPLPEQIIIRNVSNRMASPGIGMSGSGSVFKRGVNSGASVEFQITPNYFVGLFNDVVRGEVISGNVIIGPQKLTYPSGKNTATVTADLEGFNIVLRIDYQ